MKSIKLLFASALVSMSICSCDIDPLDFFRQSHPKSGQISLLDGAMDLTYGNDVVILNMDNYSEGILLGIPASEGSKVDVCGRNRILDYRTEKREGGLYLVPVFARQTDEPITYDEVRISVCGNRELNKAITVIIRDEIPTDNIDIDSGVGADVATRLVNLLGRGICIKDKVGDTKFSVFDQNLLTKYPKAYDFTDGSQELEYYCTSAASIRSITRAHSVELGISALIPIIPESSLYLNLGVNFNYSQNNRVDNSWEYAFSYAKAKRAEGAIRKDFFLDKGGWAAIIDTTLNDIMNNPGSRAYQEYPVDTAGTYALLDSYGTHFYTACQLGGEAIYEFSKRKDLTEKNMAWGVGVDVAFNMYDLKIKDKMTNFLYNVLMSNIVEIEANYKGQKKDYLESSQFSEYRKFYGGNTGEGPKTCDEWKITDKPELWVPISYAKQTDVEMMRRNADYANPNLFQINKLCFDTKSERYRSIEKALTPDPVTRRIPYYEHCGLYKYVPEKKMVVADVYLSCIDGAFNPQKGDDTPFFMTTPSDQVKRMYYPMMKNANAGFHTEHIGYACDVQVSYFSGHASKSRMYVWYALDWERPGVGITNVRLGKSESVELGENCRGTYTDRWVGSDPKNGHQYIIVKWATDSTAATDKISGVGLCYTSWDSDNGDKKGLVFASTGGTEWDNKYNFGDPAATAYFNSYWGPKVNFHRCEDDEDTQDSFVHVNNQRPHTMHLCWTKDPIRRDMSGYGDNEYVIGMDIKKTSPIAKYFRF